VFLSNSSDLYLFIEKFKDCCNEIRFSLTFRFEEDIYRGWSLSNINTLLSTLGATKTIEYKEVDYLPNKRNVYLIYL
jgi:hypothetical protein